MERESFENEGIAGIMNENFGEPRAAPCLHGWTAKRPPPDG